MRENGFSFPLSKKVQRVCTHCGVKILPPLSLLYYNFFARLLLPLTPMFADMLIAPLKTDWALLLCAFVIPAVAFVIFGWIVPLFLSLRFSWVEAVPEEQNINQGTGAYGNRKLPPSWLVERIIRYVLISGMLVYFSH